MEEDCKYCDIETKLIYDGKETYYICSKCGNEIVIDEGV